MVCQTPCMDNSIKRHYGLGEGPRTDDEVESLVKTGLIRYFAGADVGAAIEEFGPIPDDCLPKEGEIGYRPPKKELAAKSAAKAKAKDDSKPEDDAEGEESDSEGDGEPDAAPESVPELTANPKPRGRGKAGSKTKA